MSGKKIIYSEESPHAILRGVNQLADAVKVTLGPRGRNVVIEKKFSGPTITKDGVAEETGIKLEKLGLDDLGRAKHVTVDKDTTTIIDGAVVIENVRTRGDVKYGFNAATTQYEDLVEAGVIDPAKVTRSVQQNASSIASLMLTAEAMVCEPGENKDAASWNPREGSDFGE